MLYNFEIGKRYECEYNGRVRTFTVTKRTKGDTKVISEKRKLTKCYVTAFFEDTKESVTAMVYKDSFRDCEKFLLWVLDQNVGHILTVYADNAEDVDPTADWTWREREEEGYSDPEYWAIQDAILNGDFA